MSSPTHGDTPLLRRAARISAAQAVVKADRRLGRATERAIVALAEAELVPGRREHAAR